MTQTFRQRLASLATVFLLSAPAFSQLPAARLTSIFPPGGKAGATLDVTVSGADLDDAGEIRFSVPGIIAKPADASDSATDRKFSITISPDLAPGNYEARVVGRFGVTNPRGFVVGDRPEIVAMPAGPAPTALPLDSVANARCQPNAVDTYSLELKQGQRAIIYCAVRELDSKMIPVMTLDGPRGNELARGRRGELIDFTAPADGIYTLGVHDLLYKGGPDYSYRLTASTHAYIDAIYPPAGVAGSKARYRLLGRNLPGGKLTPLRASDGKALEQLDVEIEIPVDPSPAARSDALSLLGAVGAGIDAVTYRLKTDGGVSNPVLIGMAQAPLLVNQEPNQSADKAQKLSAPMEVVGRFYPHGSRDFYTFDAEKNAVYWIEIFSTRLGQHTSPELLVQTVGTSNKGVEQVNDVQDIGGPDMQPMGKRGGGASAAFPAPSRDVEYRLEAKDAASYRLVVRDLFDESEDNASLAYCMLIHKASPDFHLAATTAPLPARDGNNNVQDPSLFPPFLRKGGTTAIRVNVLRQDGFDEEVRVDAEGLPPGVHCAPAVVPSGETVTNLMLIADEKADGWSGNIRIVGKANSGDGEQARTARVGAITWPTLNPGNGNVERAQSRLCAEMPLAVSADEVEPVSLELADTSYEAKPDGKIHLSVKVKRRMEITQALKIQVAGLPRANNNGKADMIVAPGADSASFDLDVAQQRLTPGVYTFYLVAQAPVKYERKGGKSKDDPNANKRQGDSPATFFSGPITLKIIPK